MSKSYCEKVLHEVVKTIFDKEEDIAYSLDHSPNNEVNFDFMNRKKFGNDKVIEVNISLKSLKLIEKYLGDDKE